MITLWDVELKQGDRVWGAKLCDIHMESVLLARECGLIRILAKNAATSGVCLECTRRNDDT